MEETPASLYHSLTPRSHQLSWQITPRALKFLYTRTYIYFCIYIMLYILILKARTRDRGQIQASNVYLSGDKKSNRYLQKKLGQLAKVRDLDI